MSEQNNANATPAIEDEIREKLTGDAQKSALDYVAFVKANGSEPHIFINPTGYKYAWSVCLGNWDSVLSRGEYQDFPIDEKLKTFAWAHVRPCSNYISNGNECGCGFQPGRRRTIFGKDFFHTCHGGIEFGDLSGETLELAKQFAFMYEQMIADAASKDKPYAPGENEWLPVKGTQTGRPLGKIYTKFLNVQFFLTPRRRYAWDAFVGFSGGGWAPATRAQLPVGLNLSSNSRIEAYKGPGVGWTAVETLKYQADVTYIAEMSINVTNSTFSATVWMLDAEDKQDTPYFIAKDFPFRIGGDPAIPAITAIDTVYIGQDGSHILAFTIRDFEVVGGE